jgi:hypothetical protein
MSYEDKYLKYKNKYTSLKKTLIGGATKVVKVLIVVDVQDCFLNGTMASPDTEAVERFKKRIFNFVINNKNEYDVIIFTKDNHPQHHMSSGLYFPHCIEGNANYCGKELREPKVRALFKTSFLYNEVGKGKISYDDSLAKDNPSSKTGKSLGNYKGKSFEDEKDFKYNTKIQLDPDYLRLSSRFNDLEAFSTGSPLNRPVYMGKDDKGNPIQINPIMITPKEPKDLIDGVKPYIIRMNKGELCNFDAYGAFAYHVSYQENQGKLGELDIVHNPSLTPDKLNWKNLSTGLAEFLLKRENYSDKFLKDANKRSLFPNFNIDVCGLVTNICVVSTCVTGSKVFQAHGHDHFQFNILNQYCMNLPNVPRNAQKIINDNNLQKKISITDDLDVNDFNPKSEKLN